MKRNSTDGGYGGIMSEWPEDTISARKIQPQKLVTVLSAALFASSTIAGIGSVKLSTGMPSAGSWITFTAVAMGSPKSSIKPGTGSRTVGVLFVVNTCLFFMLTTIIKPINFVVCFAGTVIVGLACFSITRCYYSERGSTFGGTNG